MSEPKSCANCKYGYVDNLFYEWQCERRGCRPVLDDDGEPVDNNKCKKWEAENNG